MLTESTWTDVMTVFTLKTAAFVLMLVHRRIGRRPLATAAFVLMLMLMLIILLMSMLMLMLPVPE